MKFKQRRWADLRTPYQGGWCLSYVQEAYKANHWYATALDQWNHSIQHKDLVPLGVEAPVYFTLSGEPAGHIAIQLTDGSIASSSLPGWHPSAYIHRDLDDLMDFYGTLYDVTYLGFSEDVGGVRVLEAVKEKPKKVYNNANDLMLF